MTLRLGIAVAICAAGAAVLAIPVFRRLAMQRRLVDVAGDDPLKVHKEPVPFVGGLGIVLGFVCGLVVAGSVDRGLVPAALLLLAAGGVVAVLGFADDISTVRPSIRFAVELVAALVVAFGGAAVALFDPSRVPIVGAPGAVGMTAFAVLVAFFVVGAINAVNMQDGLDGLAGGVALISCCGFGVVGLVLHHPFVVAASVSLGAALAGFLVFNFNPASVFMGDNGSYFVGLVVAGLGLTVLLHDGTLRGLAGGVLLIGAPVFDAAFALVRRLSKGVSPFEGDRSHFYDLLSQRGLGIRTVALTCYVLQLALVAAGAWLLLR